ncbi:MAG: hypothetical protein U0840_22735 [Gemmataceae bacterium]
MNFLFGTLWLAGAVGLFGYELYSGEKPFTIRGLNVSAGWLFLVLAGWNLSRWYSAKVHKAEQAALQQNHEERLRQARQHERPGEYDPTFDFSQKPTAPGEFQAPPQDKPPAE